jgi:hypothetical protein
MRYITIAALLSLATGMPAVAATQVRKPGAVGTESYRLVEVAGKALPVVLKAEDGCREELTAAALVLEPTGRWTLNATERDVCAGGLVREEEHLEEGSYMVEGQRLKFVEKDDDGDADDAEDPPGDIDIDELNVGERGADGITVHLRDGRTVLVFRK